MSMVKAALVAIVAALVLVACGSTGSGIAAGRNPQTPSPTITGPAPGFDAVATESDVAITLHTGQKLEVVLRARSGMTDWSNVRSSDASVMSPIPNPAAGARGVTLAAFQALAPGEAVITATAGASCSAGQACPMFALLYTLDVTVT